jgi:regulatory protein
MSVITRLSPQRRDPSRVNVYLDGQFAFGLAATLAEERGLRVGHALRPEEIAALQADDELGKATDRALAFLTYRPRSIREVRDRLAKKGVEPEVVEAVLERLAGWGYVGDEGFARYWIENRGANQPRGRRLLQQELWRKGVEKETIDQALEESELDEDAGALALARKRLPQLRALDEPTQRRRLAAYLQRRGYDYPTTRRALDTLLNPDDGDAEEGDPLGDSDSYAYDGADETV